MLGSVTNLDQRLLSRRCVGCGYDGALLRGGLAVRCARCGCDLRQRPARSYAEMEGLIGGDAIGETPPVIGSDRERTSDLREALIHRWLAFLFGSMILIFAILCLSNAALSAV